MRAEIKEIMDKVLDMLPKECPEHITIAINDEEAGCTEIISHGIISLSSMMNTEKALTNHHFKLIESSPVLSKDLPLFLANKLVEMAEGEKALSRLLGPREDVPIN